MPSVLLSTLSYLLLAASLSHAAAVAKLPSLNVRAASYNTSTRYVSNDHSARPGKSYHLAVDHGSNVVVQDIIRSECIPAVIPANFDDCDGLCAGLADSPLSGFTIQPFNIQTFEAFTCGFEILNTDPCNALTMTFPEASVLCNRVLPCVSDRADGIVEERNPNRAYAIFGLPAAPPYPSPRECGL